MKTTNYQGALQAPFETGFNSRSTAEDVIKGVNLTGKIAIVTGGNTGIGLETTRVLAAAGARVIVAARDMEKARRNITGIEGAEVAHLDLASAGSIETFARQFLSNNTQLHLLINNAGIMWVPLRRDERGFESQFAINYLGHFHLTAKLWPALKAANGARVVNVSSFGHQFAPVNLDDLHFEQRTYQTLEAYGQSKTAMNLFAMQLDALGHSHKVSAFSLHPGSINGTELGREAPIELFQQMGSHDEAGQLRPEVARTLKTIPQGAATTVWCATSASLQGTGGVYCENCGVAEPDLGNIEHRADDLTSMRGVKLYSLDQNTAGQLWMISEELLGFRFDVG